jgi:hypothetical protein
MRLSLFSLLELMAEMSTYAWLGSSKLIGDGNNSVGMLIASTNR